MTVAYPRKFKNAMSARDIMKRVIEDREIHLVTLNRYRYNEQRSCKDLTELLEKLDGKPKELIQDLSHHISDEARHAYWLTDLLIELGADVGTPPGLSYLDEFERLIDQDRFHTEEQREDGILSALAAINVTEKRGCEYFSAHIQALKDGPPTEENLQIQATLEKIFPEEAGHVRWGNRWLAQIAKKSPEHRAKVDRAKRKYTAIEQAAYESGMDITMGAELRRVSNLMEIVSTMPVWERPQYLMERLPQTLLDPKLQLFRLEAAQKAWSRDPQMFIDRFIPMFFNQENGAPPKPEKAPLV
jgi:rubrerythrin